MAQKIITFFTTKTFARRVECAISWTLLLFYIQKALVEFASFSSKTLARTFTCYIWFNFNETLCFIIVFAQGIFAFTIVIAIIIANRNVTQGTFRMSVTHAFKFICSIEMYQADAFVALMKLSQITRAFGIFASIPIKALLANANIFLTLATF